MMPTSILIIGCNPTDAHPVFGSRMKKRLREGAKLIVIDPRRTDLVRSPHIAADYHLALRPGTNVAIVTALASCDRHGRPVWNEAFVARPPVIGTSPGLGGFVAEERNSPRPSRNSAAFRE